MCLHVKVGGFFPPPQTDGEPSQNQPRKSYTEPPHWGQSIILWGTFGDDSSLIAKLEVFAKHQATSEYCPIPSQDYLKAGCKGITTSTPPESKLQESSKYLSDYPVRIQKPHLRGFGRPSFKETKICWTSANMATPTHDKRRRADATWIVVALIRICSAGNSVTSSAKLSRRDIWAHENLVTSLPLVLITFCGEYFLWNK